VGGGNQPKRRDCELESGGTPKKKREKMAPMSGEKGKLGRETESCRSGRRVPVANRDNS